MSGKNYMNVADARQALLDALAPVSGWQSVPLRDALGRVLFRDVIAPFDVPAHTNSAMDGYAVRSADVTTAGVCLPVSQRIPAGTVGVTLQPGTAARIFTGAPVPARAAA